eukprot:CAMPEP_0194482160 /NCGR_PEP_ID=MMETSP0253-20130528/4243_1 /TAXON_ID=2966 /ORGANISM="Noctiluca scintillans" /LENGTH=281 /DNA_ID=CAMNT_0039321683 /DNA_START=30 /DNA_END=875 /DNA_ORIENTATION=+
MDEEDNQPVPSNRVDATTVRARTMDEEDNDPEKGQAQVEQTVLNPQGCEERPTCNGDDTIHEVGLLHSPRCLLLTYVFRTPFSLMPCAFILAVCLIVFSILGLGGVFGDLQPRKVLNHSYGIALGFVIIVCDSKARWMEAWWNVQNVLFFWCYMLRTVHGRALFYMYVGFMLLLVVPGDPRDISHPHLIVSDKWMLITLSLSGAFVLLGFLCICLYWIGWRHTINIQGYGTPLLLHDIPSARQSPSQHGHGHGHGQGHGHGHGQGHGHGHGHGRAQPSPKS